MLYPKWIHVNVLIICGQQIEMHLTRQAVLWCWWKAVLTLLFRVCACDLRDTSKRWWL